jgi:radical SAM superfamily enzyme YgiQ (UPF0313 family)
MNIGLIFPNKDRKDKTVHLGLGYLASYARSIHSDLKFIILDTRVATKNEIKQFYNTSFDLVGITVLSPVYHEVIQVFEQLRNDCNAKKIVLGGPYVTTLMEEIFLETPADFAVYGEGELTFSELIFHMKKQRSISSINGLMYKSETGAVMTNPPREHIKNLDILPFPAYDLFPMDRYPLHRIVTSRGCPYSCSFCNSTSIWQNTWRARKAENVVEEISFLLKNYKNKTFCFSDNSFNIDLARVNSFCDIIKGKRLRFLWSTPVRVEKINQELAFKMRKAGCFNVGIGIESANNRILENMCKHLTVEEVTAGIKTFKDAGIEVLGQFVIGSPGDTLQTVKESIDFAKKFGLDFVMFYSILPFKGTPQWDYVKANGTFLSDTIHDYHTVKPRIVFETPEFTYAQRLQAIKLASKEGFYCDSNDKNPIYDFGRSIVKTIQNYLPASIGNRMYLVIKNLYRKKLWRGN